MAVSVTVCSVAVSVKLYEGTCCLKVSSVAVSVTVCSVALSVRVCSVTV